MNAPEDPRVALGRRLRQARHRVRATQWRLARAAGLPQSAIAKAEGGAPVNKSKLARIVAAVTLFAPDE